METQNKITNGVSMGAASVRGRRVTNIQRKRRCFSFGCFAAITLASGAAAALAEPGTAIPVEAQPTLQGSALSRDQPVGTNGSSAKWGIGTSATYPINSIYMVQLSYSVWSMGEVLTGYAYQHWFDKGRSHAHTLILGYRQFIWRGLHAEVELWPAYNPFKSAVDGKTYRGVELWASARVGYRFDLKVHGCEFFILPQPSLGLGIARQNPWPNGPSKGPSGFHPIFEPQLIVGARF